MKKGERREKRGEGRGKTGERRQEKGDEKGVVTGREDIIERRD